MSLPGATVAISVFGLILQPHDGVTRRSTGASHSAGAAPPLATWTRVGLRWSFGGDREGSGNASGSLGSRLCRAGVPEFGLPVAHEIPCQVSSVRGFYLQRAQANRLPPVRRLRIAKQSELENKLNGKVSACVFFIEKNLVDSSIIEC